jgi:hypothetical protein
MPLRRPAHLCLWNDEEVILRPTNEQESRVIEMTYTPFMIFRPSWGG